MDEHREGKRHSNAGAISRRPVKDNGNAHLALLVMWHRSVLGRTPKSIGHPFNRVIGTLRSSMGESGRKV